MKIDCPKCRVSCHEPVHSRLKTQDSRLLFLLLALLFTTVFAAPAFSPNIRAQRLLLIGQGPDGHPPGTHEFMAGVKVLEKLLSFCARPADDSRQGG